MKPIALTELYSVFAFFLKENSIEEVNFKYYAFFLKNYEKLSPINNLLSQLKPAKYFSGSGINASDLENIPIAEYNFCLSRLSKHLSNKEKLCVLLLLLDLCHDSQTFQKKPLILLENTAKKLDIDFSWFLTLKQLSIIPNSQLSRSIIEKKILLLHESDLIDFLNPKPHPTNDDATLPVLGYMYLQEELLAFVRVFDIKAQLNGSALELNKIYPMSEGDVLSINNTLLSFNGLFLQYFNDSLFAPLKINATESTPDVFFDPQKNILEIKGCSIPENSVAFYSKISNWLENYFKTNPNHIKVNIRLDYFNTTSSKCILDLLFRLQSYKTDDIEMQINWFFQDGDEDLEEAGLNYSEIIKIPFAVIPYC
jgi:hypothetical protein